MSRLDVLVPHYRDPAGLAASLASIAAQTWTGDLRVIVLDDGSPVFRDVEAAVAAQPMPVTLLRHGENRGRPAARNSLLDAVEADYVAWLDAGDVWYPEKLAVQFDQLSRLRFEGADIGRVWITCHYDWQWHGRKPRLIQQDTAGDQQRALMLGDKLRAYLWTLLGTASSFRAVGRFDEALPRMQDLDFFLRFVRAGGALVAPPGRQALCRYHKSDVGRDAGEISRCHARILAKYRTSYQAYGRDFLAAVRYNGETLAARYAKNNGDNAVRGYHLARAFVASPRRTAGLLRGWLGQRNG